MHVCINDDGTRKWQSIKQHACMIRLVPADGSTKQFTLQLQNASGWCRLASWCRWIDPGQGQSEGKAAAGAHWPGRVICRDAPPVNPRVLLASPAGTVTTRHDARGCKADVSELSTTPISPRRPGKRKGHLHRHGILAWACI